MAGYREAGERAIRIDMLERLADMLRQENSRAGFEARADMLSITGLSLEQFAHLMEGLGYRAEKGERPKVRVAPPPAPGPDLALPPEAAEAGTPEVVAASEPAGEEAAADSDALTGESAAEIDRAPPEAAPAGEEPPAEPAAEERAPDVEPEAPEATEPPEAVTEAAETEVFYTFTWGGGRGRRDQGERRAGGRPRREKSQGDRPADSAKPRGDQPREGREDRPRGKGPKGKRPPREETPRTFEARPARKERIDPDNPFAAALMGFRTKD